MKSSGPKSNRKAKRQREKAQRRITKMAQKGKLRRHMKDRVKVVQERRKAAGQKRREQIHWDWLIDRHHRKAERERLSDEGSSDAEGTLPMDMLDPDFPLDANFYKMLLAKERAKEKGGTGEGEEEMDGGEWDDQVRTFVDEKELLPVKIDGKLVRRFKREKMSGKNPEEDFDDEKKDIGEAIKEEMVEEGEAIGTEKDQQNVDLAAMDDQELAEYYKKLLAQSESLVASAADQIILDPRENVAKFRTLLRMAAGEGGLSALIREPIQKLATASLAELFRNVLPGYPIHVLSEAEKSQKMRKETKRLAAFEESLLNYYLKYLKFLEKNATKLLNSGKSPTDESNFSAQFGFLCARCLGQLATTCAHFNYAPNIISCLVRLSLSKWQKLIDLVCTSISAVFAADSELKISLHGVKAVAILVEKKKGYVPPELISTLLALNIKEIDRKNGAEKNQKKQQRASKKMPNVPKKRRKFDKQLGKLEVELEEALASNAHSNKLRLGTDVMRHVFLTFFRILRRMAQSALLRPVLEGLSKFVHLINVEFYDDLLGHLGRLVEQKQLKVSETLHCVRTVAHILTGEGQAIDVDLHKFYRALYSAMPSICFQASQALESGVSLLVNALQLLLVQRRKSVSPAKVAAFTKRIALIVIPIGAASTRATVALLLMLRRLFSIHSNLRPLLNQNEGEEEDDDFLVVSGHFRPDTADPEYSNALGTTTICAELKLLSKMHPNALARQIAQHLLNGLPAAGKHRLDTRWTSIEPSDIFASNDPSLGGGQENNNEELAAKIQLFFKKQKMQFCSDNLCSGICKFVANFNGA